MDYKLMTDELTSPQAYTHAFQPPAGSGAGWRGSQRRRFYLLVDKEPAKSLAQGLHGVDVQTGQGAGEGYSALCRTDKTSKSAASHVRTTP